MSGIYRVFLVTGSILVFIGIVLFFLDKANIPIGKLPGDILIKKENFSFYFPVTTSVLMSIIVGVIVYIFRK